MVLRGAFGVSQGKKCGSKKLRFPLEVFTISFAATVFALHTSNKARGTSHGTLSAGLCGRMCHTDMQLNLRFVNFAFKAFKRMHHEFSGGKTLENFHLKYPEVDLRIHMLGK
jgi:hypothetical protein